MGPHPPPQPPTRWTASGPPAPGGTASSGPCSITSAGIFGLAGGGGRFRTVSPAPGSGLAGVPFSLLSRAFARPRARRLMHILGAGACAPIRPLRGGCPPMGPSRALPRGPARTHGASASGLEGAPLRPLVFTQESRVWPPQRGQPARRRQNKAGRGRIVDTPADGTPSPQARPRSVAGPQAETEGDVHPGPGTLDQSQGSGCCCCGPSVHRCARAASVRGASWWPRRRPFKPSWSLAPGLWSSWLLFLASS